MHDVVHEVPRWGNEARERKALAIWLTLLQCCGPRIAEGAWLDVGCGSGGIAATLATKVRLVTGVDPEPWDAWAEAMTTHANLKLIAGVFDGDTPPVADASIDVVVCNQVYEHVTDPIALVRNIHRVLVPGGVCYFAGPNLLWPIEPHVSWPFVHWLPRQLAQALMRALGSSQAEALDAYSTHCWRIRRWFRDSRFEVRFGLRDRIVAELELRGWIGCANWVRHLPIGLLGIGEPLTPGFIYVLKKLDRVGHG